MRTRPATEADVVLCERDGYVEYLAVAEEQRGRGLGKALLQAALAGFARAGIERAVLWVNGRNESATRFYRNAGMEVAFSADRYEKTLSG
jgi:ribosomal protein S18 acetylase RimI-like enzyme